MLRKPCLSLGLGIYLQVFFALAPGGRAAERMLLDHAIVVSDSGQPSFVQYGIEELVGYLKESTGNEIPVVVSPEETKRVQILVGAKSARQVFPEMPPREKFGEEGYLLRSLSKDGAEFIIAAGADPHGTKAALAALMKTIQVEGSSAFVPAPLDRLVRPAVARRGIHFNGWAFNAPYSFRNWREEDWRRYLDLLAFQGVNLFYLWPFMEIMPVPLSPEDQAYLEECRRVVDYAQRKHGMEVWIMQCTNRVAKDRCSVADPRRRPYWRPAQEDLDPGKPQHFQAIMDSREALYRILNNVDGVCNIDSDPGYCPGSPLSDYFKVLQGCRALLDRHNLHGRQAKLVHWMWSGWGRTPGQTESIESHHRRTLQGLKQNLPEPWGLIAGWGALLPLCREENVLEKTVLLPYGVIEGEPSYPATNLQIDALREQFENYVAPNPELSGVMGNMQTPLLQFPDMFFFTSAMFDAGYRKRPEREVLLDLSGYLYPEHQQLLADCYLALKESDPAKIQWLADRLDGVVRSHKLGRLGIFGRKLFPDHRIVAQSLILQLNLRAARQRLVQNLTLAASQADCEKLLSDCFGAYLAWDTAHGWHNLWGWRTWPLDMPPTVAGKLARILGDGPAVDACFDRVARTLSAKYDKTAVEEGCIVPWKNTVHAAVPIVSLAQKAVATASAAPDPTRHPPRAANDGRLDTLYWPGALVKNNAQWLQLTWDKPQTFDQVVVRFLQHPSMPGRTIRLQKEVAPGKWKDFAATVIPNDPSASYALATFQLPTRVTLDKIRVVNLLDLFEIEVR